MWHSLTLKAHNLACERGEKLVFSGLNFTLKSGEALELRGPNGSGKSSLLRLIAGLNQLSEGTLSFSNQAEFGNLTHYVGHHDAIKLGISVQENINFWQKFYSASTSKSLSAFRLANLAGDQARLLSSGQRRRLCLTRLVAIARPLWLLDEPTNGLDQTAIADLTREMKAHLAAGGLIIIATHQEVNLKFAHQLNLGGQK